MLRPPSHERPSYNMSADTEHEPHASCGKVLQWQHGMGSRSGEYSPSMISLEIRGRQRLGRTNGLQAKPGKPKRVSRKSRWSKQVFKQQFCSCGKILREPPIAHSILSKSARSFINRCA